MTMRVDVRVPHPLIVHCPVTELGNSRVLFLFSNTFLLHFGNF